MSRSARNILAGVIAFLAVIALVAAVFLFARGERTFAIGQWEKRLRVNLVDPAGKITAWLRAGRLALAQVSANETVRLYLGELQGAGFNASALPHAEAQRAYVASYIVHAGMEGPFASHARAGTGGRMSAAATAGLALFDGRQQLIASTPSYRPSPALLSFFIDAARRGSNEPQFLLLGGHPTIVFFRPVFALNAAAGAQPAGYLMAARDIDAEVAAMLASPLDADGGRVVLLARAGGRVRFLAASVPQDVPDISQEFALAAPDGTLMAAREPGRLEQGPDVSGETALFYARMIDASPLVLVAGVPAEIALAGVGARERTLFVALLLAIVAVVAVGIAFSRHAMAVTARERAQILEREAAVAARREALLKLVVDAHPGALLLISGGGIVTLASARFAGELGLSAEALIGKSLASVLPAAWRSTVLAMLARRGEGPIVREDFQDGRGHAYAAMVVSLPEAVDPAGGALLLVNEVTELVDARERRAQLYRGIVTILLEAIDRRDPDAAAHSRHVGALARRIAIECGMDEADVETVDLAGSLQAVGRLFVPDRLLTRHGPLDGDERQRVEEGAERWLALLAQISVDYPVAAVTRLAHELARGRGVRESDRPLLDKAWAVAAADGFVALASARSYRAGRSTEQALQELSEHRLPGVPGSTMEALHRTVGAGTGVAEPGEAAAS